MRSLKVICIHNKYDHLMVQVDHNELSITPFSDGEVYLDAKKVRKFAAWLSDVADYMENVGASNLEEI